jgi:hypothetical protein
MLGSVSSPSGATAMTLPSLALTLLVVVAQPASKEAPLYELRIYTAAPGKLDALHARFRDHTMKLFEEHGMTNLGYWVPIDNPDSKLYYVLSYPNEGARKKSWSAFINDPDWKKAAAESEKDGKLVAKAESLYLQPTDYSPEVKLSKADPPRTFELRTYTTTKGKLDALNARFRNHTVKLFEKHGMTNLWYWTPTKATKTVDTENTLVYILAHKSPDEAKKSFDAFRMDPDWVAARAESEKKAGGSLTAKDGVKSVLHFSGE